MGKDKKNKEREKKERKNKEEDDFRTPTGEVDKEKVKKHYLKDMMRGFIHIFNDLGNG